MALDGLPYSARMKAVAASVCAGLAAWCSLGTIGLIGAGSLEMRVGLLPPWWLLPILVVVILTAIRLARLSPAAISPLFGSAVLLLPWLPFPVPPAALLWTGPFMATVWTLVLVSVALTRWPATGGRWFTEPRRAATAAAAVALTLYGASAWWLAPILPDGDSPHYLILAQSLIRDGDLQIENNHRRGDYLEYSLTSAQPDYLRRGVNGAIYSIHSLGLPAIIAPAMWAFGYPGVVAFLGVVAALSTALVWRFSYLVTASAPAAWFGWACCALTTPFFFQATQVFPDGIAATCLLLGIVPLLVADADAARDRPHDAVPRQATAIWWLSGAALAILPWLQARLAMVALAAAVCLCLRMRSRRQFLIFAALPVVSAIAWFAYFLVVYGTPNPTAPYGTFTQTSVANLSRGLPGLLFDQQFGLMPNAPVYGFVLGGILAAATRGRRWSWELMALAAPYTIGVGMYQHWWGGASPPGRLLTAIVLVVAVGAARAWHLARTWATRAVYFAALVVSALTTMWLLVPEGGQLLLNFRDGVSLWIEWGNDLLDVPRGLPSLFTDEPQQALLEAAIWIASAAAGWLALQAVGRRRSQSDKAPFLSSTAIWCLAAVPMIALTLTWRTGGVQPLTPARSEVELLRQKSALRPLAYDFAARRFAPSAGVLSRARVRPDLERPRASPAQLLSARNVPAGAYQLHVTASGAAEGMLTLRIGDTSLPYATSPASRALMPASAPSIELATGVRSLVVEGDAAAVRSVSSVNLEPVPSSLGGPVADGFAHRAAAYAPRQAFFLDDNAYPEPTGFWVAGGRRARIVIAGAGQDLVLFLRNAPVDNAVVIDTGVEQFEIALGPGEEREIALRAPPGSGADIRITSRSGFRPSEQEPGNRDLRYLGCWVEIR